MLSDLKYALRRLAKSPGFTAFVVLTLALGIGANTAIFSVIDSVLLSTLPVKDPHQLVFLTNPESHGYWRGGGSGNRDYLTYPEFQYLRDKNEVFSGICAIDSSRRWLPVTTSGPVQPGKDADTIVSMVSGGYFSVLGVIPALGRTFGSEVGKARDANAVAVISYRYWQNQLGGDHDVLGRSIHIRSTPYTIIGVLPHSFSGETVGLPPDVWIPLTMQAEAVPGSDWLSPEKSPLDKMMWLQVLGRLKPGVTVAQANAGINVAFLQYLRAQLGSGIPENGQKDFLDQHIVLTEGSHGGSIVRNAYGQPLILLMALVVMLLLIACVNVANLLLARAASRQKEIAVRIAVGAKPTRIFRQLLTESILLATIGGSLGLLFARWGDSVLLQFAGQDLDVHPNAAILTFTFAASIFVGVLFGMAPALHAARLDLSTVLKGSIGGAVRGRRLSMGRFLLVAQIALSLLLVIIAGLFVHSFQRLATVKLGYDQDHLLLAYADPKVVGYKGPALMQLCQRLIDRINAIPGVRSTTVSQNFPFTSDPSGAGISIDDYTPTSGQAMGAHFSTVGPNYFSTVGIPILMGREIGPQDREGGQRVGVINQNMARYYFGEANPIGRRIRTGQSFLGHGHADFIVVGVVADAKYISVKEGDLRRFYVPYYDPMSGITNASFIIRAAGNPAALIAAVSAAVKETAPSLPNLWFQTMDQIVDRSLTPDRVLTKLSSFFGALAAGLASIGIYGLMSYMVSQRTREIGVRMALGAQRSNVLWLILNESLFLTLIGVVIGVPAAVGAGKFVTGLLFGLTSVDLPVLAAAVGLMFVVAAVAGYFPARRATRVDPLVALRTE